MTFNANVIGNGLNLRSTCSTSSTRLTQIPTGTAIVVEIVAGEPEWFATSYNGYTGYVVAQYVAITADGGECTPNVENSLNIRKTTSTSSTRLYSAYPNASLRLLDYTSVAGWYRISSASGTGWAVSDYLTVISYPQDNAGGSGGDVVDPTEPDAPEYYGVTRNHMYHSGWQGYYCDNPGLNLITTNQLGPVVAGVTIPLWSVTGYTDVFRTKYNGNDAYVAIDYVQLLENGTPNLSQALGSHGAGVINCKYHLMELHYHPYEITPTFDGIMTVATKLFQRDNGLNETGIIDASTRELLCSGTAEHWHDDGVDAWLNAETVGILPPMQWFMNDRLWVNYPWPSEAVGNETIGKDGNSITTLAMLATTCLNRCITPVEMAEFTLKNHYRDPKGQTGINNKFYSEIENHYIGVIYSGYTTSMDEVKQHVANGGLAVADVTADENKTYTGGATQLLVYRVDDNVYVRSPNANKNPSAPLSFSEWKNGGWFRKAYLYDRAYG